MHAKVISLVILFLLFLGGKCVCIYQVPVHTVWCKISFSFECRGQNLCLKFYSPLQSFEIFWLKQDCEFSGVVKLHLIYLTLYLLKWTRCQWAAEEICTLSHTPTYACTHTHTCTLTWAHTHTHTHTHMHMHTRNYKHTHTQTHTHKHTYPYKHIHMHTHTHAHPHTHMHMHICNYKNTHTQTHTEGLAYTQHLVLSILVTAFRSQQTARHLVAHDEWGLQHSQWRSGSRDWRSTLGGRQNIWC